jgi:curved DNA-binding protein
VDVASKDLYAVLGVPRGASQDEVRDTYRKLARKLHPDVNPDDAAAEARFKEVTAAYQVLSDVEKRSLYNEFGDVALQAGFDKARAEQMRRFGGGGSAFDFGNWSQGYASGGGSLEEMLANLVGGRFGGGGRRGPRKGENLVTEVGIDLPMAISGGTTTLRLELAGREEIDVRIPPGIADGQSLRLAGLGRSGSGGAPAGDLLVKIKVLPHPCYRREGDDLHVDVPITVGEAVRGAELRFQGPTGEIAIKVSPGTKSGQSLRLRGLGAKGTGNLYARLLVATPLPPDATDEREAFDQVVDKLATYYPDDPRVQVRF